MHSQIFVLKLVVALFISLQKQSLALLSAGLGSEDELRLISRLFDVQGYNPLIRPVRNTSEKIMVQFGVAMAQLITIDEKNQIMKSNLWLRMTWDDYHLKWDPAEYGGITVVRIAPEKVWTPDIVLFNNADGKYEVTYKSRILVHNTGHIQFIPPSIYKSSCRIDVEYFPFDEQNCTLNFGSWTFNGDQVSLEYYENKQYVDLNDYLISGTWDVIDCPGHIQTWRESRFNVTRNMTQMQYILRIRRKTLFYTVNLIIPCVLISFLTVCVFYLPAEANEKIHLSISILFAMTLFMLLVQKILPPTSTNIPLIAYYLSFTFCLNIVSIFTSVLIVNWSTRTPKTHTLPQWLRTVFIDVLPTALLMKRPLYGESRSKAWHWHHNMRNRGSRSRESLELMTNLLPHSNLVPLTNHVNDVKAIRTLPIANNVTTHQSMDSSVVVRNRTYMSKSTTTIESMTEETNPLAFKACKAVTFIASHLHSEDECDKELEDWKYIGLVIDRILLIVFLIVTVGGTFGIIFNNPNIFEYVDQQAIIARIQGQKTV